LDVCKTKPKGFARVYDYNWPLWSSKFLGFWQAKPLSIGAGDIDLGLFYLNQSVNKAVMLAKMQCDAPGVLPKTMMDNKA
jgi:hypothetical protein